MNNDPPFIYLDQNQWIYLAQANYNSQEGEKYKLVLKKLQDLVENDKVRLPLSAYHFLETQKIRNIDRKEKLAETMSILSQGWGIALLDNVTPIEVQIAGARIFGCPLPSRPKVFEQDLSLIWGINLQAIANKIAGEKNEPMASSKEFLANFKKILATPKMIKMFLTGNIISESQLTDALAGYKFGISNFAKLNESVRSKVKHFSKSQLPQKRIFISDYVRGKETREFFNNALAIYDKTIDDVISLGEEETISFIESIPTLDLETELVTMRNVHWDRMIDENDWADIRSLVIAVPYCDIVVTENFWHDLIQRSKVDKKYKTTILKNVNELLDYI
ncbi:MAG: hypothetical protein Q8L41_05630 [Anaerolineales bacterium]|nr:hypothetical protein [Anaerolineales bacterium]